MGELTALPSPLAVFKGPTSSLTGRRGHREGGRGREWDGDGGKER